MNHSKPRESDKPAEENNEPKADEKLKPVPKRSWVFEYRYGLWDI